jgi:uncharacterized protein YprB with RNaseH-like and TPR domain
MPPKILLLDVETAPATAYIWRLFDENIGLDQLINPSRIICWGAKWLGRKEFMYADERAHGPGHMFGKIHTILSSADAVVTYNGDRFDLPRLNGSFVEFGLPPTPPVTSIDLLKTVRKLGVQSNKLAFIAPHLKIGNKVKTEGFKLWADCLAGNDRAWGKMRIYNEQDVRLLGRLYNVLKPYIKNHPRMYAKQDGRPSCRVCSSARIQYRGKYFTKELQYNRFQCQQCGTWDKIRAKNE